MIFQPILHQILQYMFSLVIVTKKFRNMNFLLIYDELRSTNTSKNKIKDFLYAYTNDLELEDSIAELVQILLSSF